MSESDLIPSFSVGDTVKLVNRPPYLKTADPMPMLRPADLVAIGEVGEVIDCRPAGYWGIKFSQGIFLVDTQYLALADTQP